uniref:Uncharacterized protein n=1 Tax=Panagrolaimus sp. PS1159 TaxID=55785 RepID=A0AC35GF77_9BILA
MSDQQHRRRTSSPPTHQPSLPLPLQQPQQQQPSSSTSGPSTSSSTAQQQQQPNLSNEQWAVFINQRMSGMPNATNLSEWQLQAVLFHAKLTQYYDRFISLGGDDIDQLMQCDETEFLEIMRLIGMASKPLHVRRFQRTLADFSKDRATFLRQAAVHIGPPPVMDFPTSSQTSSLQAAIQFLIPGFNPSEQQQASTSSTTSITTALSLPGSSSSSTMLQQQLHQPSTSVESPVTATMPRLYPQTSAPFFRPQLLQQQQQQPSTVIAAAAASATANVMPLPSSELLNLVGSSISNLTIPSISPSVVTIPPSFTTVTSSRTESPAIAGPSGCGSNQSIASPGSDTEYTSDPFEGGILPETDIPQIIRLAKNLYSKKPDLHTLEPRYVQNKKKLPKELIDVMKLPAEDKNRLSEFRKFSAIYGRYDAKRKPDKPLSYHELLVNEAAAQLCLIQPVLLTRRDELFPLARQVVRESNFPGFRTLSRTERKRPYDTKSERSTSPHSVASNRDSPELSTLERRSSSSHPKHDPSPNTPSTRSSTSGGKRAKSEY